MTAADAWHLRLRTLEAAVGLVLAKAAIAWLPLDRWRGRFGLAGPPDREHGTEACRLARHVDRAAGKVPLDCKCLPRAMALSMMLRRRGIPHRVAIAARPAGARTGMDDLHAWVELDGTIVMGELPGPWALLLTLP